MFCTYLHKRNSDNKVFYVGAGSLKRPYSKQENRRSKNWVSVVKEHGYTVDVLAHWDSKEDAFEHEKVLISTFRDMGHPLVNLTDGGIGTKGFKQTKESIAKMIIHHIGVKRSLETKQKMSLAKLGKTPNHKKYKCIECGLIANNGNMTQHQNKTLHLGKIEL